MTFGSLWRMVAFGFAVALTAGAVRAQEPVGLRGHGGPVRAVAVMPDGRVASAGFDGSIIIWDMATGRATRVLRFHDTAVNALIARPDGCLISGGEDARIAVWCGDTAVPREVLTGHAGPVSALAFDGQRIVSGGWDRTVRIWSEGGKPVETAAPVTSIAAGGDGSMVLVTMYDGRLELSRPDVAPLKAIFPAAINGSATLTGGHFLLAGADGRLREIDETLQVVREFELPDGPLTTVAVSPDGRTIATGGMRTPVTLIDWPSGAVRARILGPGLPLWAMAFSRDGRELYTGGADRAVRRFDIVTGKTIGADVTPVDMSAPPEPKDRGAQVFRACRACHGLTAGDTNLAGPTLHHIMGRRIASAPGYDYSAPFKVLDIVWTPETIAKLFEVGPLMFTPGTKMPEQRITDPEDRKALVEWLARVTVGK